MKSGTIIGVAVVGAIAVIAYLFLKGGNPLSSLASQVSAGQSGAPVVSEPHASAAATGNYNYVVSESYNYAPTTTSYYEQTLSTTTSNVTQVNPKLFSF